MMDLSEAEQLILKTWELIDKAGGKGVERHFADDGTVSFGTAVNRGRAEIELVYSQRRARGERTSRHLVTNLLWSSSGATATANYIVILHAADGPAPASTTTPVALFDVRDSIISGPDGPLMRSRTMTTVFNSPEGGLAVSFDKSASRIDETR